MNDDGHSPLTCNYQRCGVAEFVRTPCPFVRSEKSASSGLEHVASKLRGLDVERKAELFDELVDVLKRMLEHK